MGAHGGMDRRLHNAGQRQPAGEAHADDPDAGAGCRVVDVPGQCADPGATGLVFPTRSRLNSRRTQNSPSSPRAVPSCSGRPKNSGRWTLKWASIRRRAKATVVGLRPATSCSTITRGAGAALEHVVGEPAVVEAALLEPVHGQLLPFPGGAVSSLAAASLIVV
jgi:hypothetical protein